MTNDLNPPPTLVFDLDGTIADTIHDLVPCLNRTIAVEGLDPVSVDEVGPISGKGVLPMLDYAFRSNGLELDPELKKKLFGLFLQDYWDHICVHSILYEGLEQQLEDYKSRDWILAVCTNKPHKYALKLLAELEIDHFFGSITGADSFEFRKPDPRHYENTVSLAGGVLGRSLMVGDSQTDIMTAKNAGVPVIAVDFGYSDEPVATYDPDRIISHYTELDQAISTIWPD